EIADHAAALQTSRHNRAARELHRLRRLIGDKRREQFELDRLHAALQHRFFPGQSTPMRPMRCFEVEICQCGSWWRIRIPELDAVTTVRQREDAELTAREHIAVIVNTPIAEISVRVVSES